MQFSANDYESFRRGYPVGCGIPGLALLLVSNGEAVARVLGLLRLINQSDGKVFGADKFTGGGVQCGVVLAGTLARCDFERRPGRP